MATKTSAGLALVIGATGGIGGAVAGLITKDNAATCRLERGLERLGILLELVRTQPVAKIAHAVRSLLTGTMPGPAHSGKR